MTSFFRRLPLYLPQLEHSYGLMIIVLNAIVLRVVAAFFLGDQVIDLPGTFDQLSYDMLAQRVVDGYGFTVSTLWWPLTQAGEPTAHWSYLYTLYVAVVYILFDHHPLVARLLQGILAGILMPWLVYRLGRRHFNQRAGLAAAGLTAVYAYFVYYAATLMTETFYIIAILWTLDLTGQLGQTNQIGQPRFKVQHVLFGLALAVTVLLRQVFLLFIPILYGWLLWRSLRYRVRPVPQILGILGVATAMVILAVVPWTYRNFRAFDGQVVLLNTNAGFAFFWGNHPIHGYNFISILPEDGPTYQELIPAELRQLNEAELDRALLTRGLSFIQAEPDRYFILSLSRLKDYFKFWPSAESGLVSNLSRVFSIGLLWPLMLYGLWLGRRQGSLVSLLYLFVLVYTVIHLLSWALIRYRLPVDAVLLIFAGVALVELWLKLTQRYPGLQTVLSSASFPGQG